MHYNCRDLHFFKHNRRKNEVRPRTGNLLLRINDAAPTTGTLRVEISRSARKALQKGRTNIKLSYERVRISGLFYRMREREAAGEYLDFYQIAKVDYEIKRTKEQEENDKKNPSEFSQKLTRLSRALQEDYSCWKAAHML